MNARRKLLKTGLCLGTATLAMGTGVTGVLAQASNTSWHRVRTPVLDIAFEQFGNPDGFPIILLHGFPYDIRSFDAVVPPLAASGFRVLLPYLRGFGATRFVDADRPRMAEQAALANDVVDFCNALDLPEVALVGFDWGNRAACIAAITEPQLVQCLVSIGGYSVQDTTAGGGPAPAALEARLWYQWYFNTERGRRGLENNRYDIIRYLWNTWSPTWTYSESDYRKSAASFDNPDFVDVVIHSYRHRHANAPGEPQFLDLERMLASRPPVEVPTIVLRPADSGFGPPSPDPDGDRRRFSRLVDRRIVPGAGHDLPVQRPDAVVDALFQLLP